MEQKALSKKARQIVTADHTSTFDNLNDYQKESLSASVMRELGSYAYEAITNASNLEKVAEAVMQALEEADMRDRAVLEKLIGKLVIDGAIEQCKKPINDVLDEELTNLSLTRQFYSDSRYEFRDPMKLSIYNHPAL